MSLSAALLAATLYRTGVVRSLLAISDAIQDSSI
jgi:hypothetical protein